MAGEPAEKVANTGRFRGWTTNAVFMGDVGTVAVATDCRHLHFINVATVGVFEDVHLLGTLCSTCYSYNDDYDLDDGSEMCHFCCQASTVSQPLFAAGMMLR